MENNLFVTQLGSQQTDINQITNDLEYSLRSSFYSGVESKLVNFLGFETGKKVLDVGCGTGFLCQFIVSKFGYLDLDITGMDLQDELLEQAVRSAESEKLPVRYIKGDAHQIPFPDESFDYLVSHTLIKWVQNPDKVLQEMHRVLKPGGRIYIAERILPPVSLIQDRFDKFAYAWIEKSIRHIPHPNISMELPNRLNHLGFSEVDCIAFSVPALLTNKQDKLKNFDLEQPVKETDKVRILVHQILWSAGTRTKIGGKQSVYDKRCDIL